MLKNEDKCSIKSDEVKIEILQPEYDFLPDSVMLCYNKQITLYPINLDFELADFLWSNHETQSSIEVQQEGTYTLTITKGECVYTDHVTVAYQNELWIPNIFTPNGDQLNDYFFIKNLHQPVILSIYDRWGKLVYKEDNYINNWAADGLENGVYFYHIYDRSGCLKEHTYKGWLQVLR